MCVCVCNHFPYPACNHWLWFFDEFVHYAIYMSGTQNLAATLLRQKKPWLVCDHARHLGCDAVLQKKSRNGGPEKRCQKRRRRNAQLKLRPNDFSNAFIVSRLTAPFLLCLGFVTFWVWDASRQKDKRETCWNLEMGLVLRTKVAVFSMQRTKQKALLSARQGHQLEVDLPKASPSYGAVQELLCSRTAHR